LKTTGLAIDTVNSRSTSVKALEILDQDPELAHQTDLSAAQRLDARLLGLLVGPLQKTLGTMA
jgi:hypothetical protein